VTEDSLAALARQFEGYADGGAIYVPASKLTSFLATAHTQGVAVPYVECLYLGSDFIEPSMELSGAPRDFSTWNEFMAFAQDIAEKALLRAQTGQSRRTTGAAEAVFEVGP